MHAQAGKRLDVSVAMVHCVDVLVQGADVDEPGKVSLMIITWMIAWMQVILGDRQTN